MVMKNPMLVTMVSAEPISSRGAVWAVSAENCGESPTTTIPQKMRNPKNISDEA